MASSVSTNGSALDAMIAYFHEHYQRIDSCGGTYDYVSDDPAPCIVFLGRLELLRELNAHLVSRGFARVSQKSDAWREFRIRCLNAPCASAAATAAASSQHRYTPSMYSSEHNTTHSIDRASGSGGERQLRLAIRRHYKPPQ